MRKTTTLLRIAILSAGAISTTALAQSTAPPNVANNADVQAAFQFLKREMTIDVSALENPEPGLSRIESIDGEFCKLRCGYHAVTSLQTVADVEFEFSMENIALNTFRSEIDSNNRAVFAFASARGTAVFRGRRRDRKVQVITFKPLSDWTKWSEWNPTEKAVCRSKPDRANFPRVIAAFKLIAKACGAREAPF